MILSVVIPAYNEAKTVCIVIDKAQKAIKELGIKGEVIVVDNNSKDETVQISNRAGARVVTAMQSGYGSACMTGFSAAKGKYIIMGDADDSYNFQEIEPFFKKLNEGYEFVIGNRFKGKIHNEAMPVIHKYFGTPFLTGITNLLFRTDIGDINCGLRGIKKSSYETLQCKALGMEFAAEMVIRASLKGLMQTEIPCSLYKDKRDTCSRLRPYRDGLRYLWLILYLFLTHKLIKR